MKISKATKQDIPELSDIAKTCFINTYSNVFGAEAIQTHAQKTFSSEALTTEFSDSNIYYFIARNEVGRLVGYSKVQVFIGPDKLPDPEWAYFNRNYVLPEAQGRGLGKQLFEHRKQIAIIAGCKKAWLVVWQDNPSVKFHESMGFKKYKLTPMQIPNSTAAPTCDMIMTMDLV